MPTPKVYVVVSNAHVEHAFPEPNREPLKAACREMLQRTGKPVAVGLTPGQFKVWPIQNGEDLVGWTGTPR